VTVPSLTLNTGAPIPQLGLGTSPLNDAQAADAVAAAIDLGYRHIDTALRYGNERGVGEGVRRGGIDRGELFVTTKLDGPYQGDDRAIGGLEESLDRLGLEYVDLLLMHWPLPARGLFVSTWHTFEKLHADGRARAIGVSNFKPGHLERLLAESETVPAVNQIELNPYVTRTAQRAFDAEHGILTESWSPFGGSGARVLDERVLAEVAARHGKTPGQVVLRWHVQVGLVVIPRSRNPQRMAENLDVFDFELSADDLAAIASLARGPGAGVDSDRVGH
jgi:2,5-diketo-D-gluconate reductase A